METGTEAVLPALASAAAIGEVAETVTVAADMPGPALATAETEENSAQVQKVPGPASAAATKEVTVTGALDRPGPALATPETEENSAQVQEVPALASDGDVGGTGSDKETEVQEVMARPNLDTAEDTVAEAAVAENGFTCKTCGKSFDSKQKLYVHNKTHVPKWCFICGKEFNCQNFSSHQVSQEERNEEVMGPLML